MKAILGTLIGILSLTATASATVDANDYVYLVVEDLNGDGGYLIERAPIIGCFGLPQGPRLSAWVSEYKAPQNVGCGMPPVQENINALTCATVVDGEEADDFLSFSKITLDISKCQDKNNPKFVKAIELSARKNFPQRKPGKTVELKLIK